MTTVITATVISCIVSFSLMKLQMKMLEKWMDRFFEEETRRIKNLIGLKIESEEN